MLGMEGEEEGLCLTSEVQLQLLLCSERQLL